jgi:N-acetyltransferase
MRDESFRTPVTLTGRYVELVPLAPAHVAELWRSAARPEVTRYLRAGPVALPDDLGRIVAEQLEAQRAGTDLPFATRLVRTHRAIGMTRFLRIDRANEGVEIGGTWLDPGFWRTPVNTEAKLLMLGHAFEVEHAHRVQLQTDLRNERSQRAIARLGAQREGVLREDVVMPDGYRRSSVYFSILAAEWPAVRARLEAMLARAWSPPTD